MSLKPRVTEASEQHNGGPYQPLSRTPFPAVTVDQSISSYSGVCVCVCVCVSVCLSVFLQNHIDPEQQVVSHLQVNTLESESSYQGSLTFIRIIYL